MQYQKYQKMQFCIQLYIHIWEIILYLQANSYQLKGYLCYKMITSQNVPSEAQVKNFLVS